MARRGISLLLWLMATGQSTKLHYEIWQTGEKDLIKNIVFDIGNVLIGFEWEEYILSLFDKETAYKVSSAMFFHSYWTELDRAVLTEDEILNLFYSAEPDYKDQIKEAFDKVGKCVAKCDFVVPLIEELHQSGYKVYFLSNMSEHVLGSNPEAFAFTEHMDGGIFSCHVHSVKPDPEIYKILFEKYDLLPEECLFIDDHAENIDASREFGMDGIVFRSEEQMKADLRSRLNMH